MWRIILFATHRDRQRTTDIDAQTIYFVLPFWPKLMFEYHLIGRRPFCLDHHVFGAKMIHLSTKMVPKRSTTLLFCSPPFVQWSQLEIKWCVQMIPKPKNMPQIKTVDAIRYHLHDSNNVLNFRLIRIKSISRFIMWDYLHEMS